MKIKRFLRVTKKPTYLKLVRYVLRNKNTKKIKAMKPIKAMKATKKTKRTL